MDHVILRRYILRYSRWLHLSGCRRDYNLHLTMWILLRTEVLLRIVLSLHCVEMVTTSVWSETEIKPSKIITFEDKAIRILLVTTEAYHFN